MYEEAFLEDAVLGRFRGKGKFTLEPSGAESGGLIIGPGEFEAEEDRLSELQPLLGEPLTYRGVAISPLGRYQVRIERCTIQSLDGFPRIKLYSSSLSPYIERTLEDGQTIDLNF
jgi:hypothetical protein